MVAMSDETQQLKQSPPVEWVDLTEETEDTCVCSYINRFYWRQRDKRESTELHVVFERNHGEDSRYRYFDVPRETYEEMWKRTHFADEYNRSIDKWFYENIRDDYEYERYKG